MSFKWHLIILLLILILSIILAWRGLINSNSGASIERNGRTTIVLTLSLLIIQTLYSGFEKYYSIKGGNEADKRIDTLTTITKSAEYYSKNNNKGIQGIQNQNDKANLRAYKQFRREIFHNGDILYNRYSDVSLSRFMKAKTFQTNYFMLDGLNEFIRYQDDEIIVAELIFIRKTLSDANLNMERVYSASPKEFELQIKNLMGRLNHERFREKFMVYYFPTVAFEEDYERAVKFYTTRWDMQVPTANEMDAIVRMDFDKQAEFCLKIFNKDIP